MALRVRTLPPEEYDRLAQFPGPLGVVAGTTQLDPEHTRLIIIEDPETRGPDGHPRILGYWTLFTTVHAEPLYLAEEMRHQPKVALQLLATVATELQDSQVQSIFAIIEPENVQVIGAMAERLGLRPLPGILYGGTVPQAVATSPDGAEGDG